MELTQSIEKWLATFEAAKIGGDVKESFVESCRTLYEDFTAGGNANFEVSQARGVYVTLAERLNAADSLDSNILATIAALEASKADKTAVNAIVNGGIAATASSIASIPADADTSRIYLITSGDDAGYWAYWDGTRWTKGGVYQARNIDANAVTNRELSNNAVAPWNCTFFGANQNLFTGEQETGYISPNGTVTNTTDAQYQHTTYIQVTAGKVYTLVYPLRVAASVKQPNVFAYKTTADTAPVKLDVSNRDATYAIFKLTIPAGYSYVRFNTASPSLGDYSDMVLIEGTYDNADILANYDLEYRYNGEVKGKTIVIAGDSITTGWQPDGSTLSTPFPARIAERMHATVYNKGVGATKIASPTGKQKDTDFCQPARYQTFVHPDDSNAAVVPDIIAIFAGVNDHTLDTPLGDLTSNDATTFYGALKVLIKGVLKLIDSDPNAKGRTRLCFATPLIRFTGTHPYGSFGDANTGYFWDRYARITDEVTMHKNSLGYRLADYVTAMKEVCALYSVPVLDLFTASSITKDMMCADGVHTPQLTSDEHLAYRFEYFIKTGMQSSYTPMFNAVQTNMLKNGAVTAEKTSFLTHVGNGSIYSADMLSDLGVTSDGSVAEAVPSTADSKGTYYKSIVLPVSEDTYYKVLVSNSSYKNQCRVALFDARPTVGATGTVILDNPYMTYLDTTSIIFGNTDNKYAMITFFDDVFAYDDTPEILIFESLSEYFEDIYRLAENVKLSNYNLEDIDLVQTLHDGENGEIELFDGVSIAGGLGSTGSDSDSDYNLTNYARTKYLPVSGGDTVVIYDPTNPQKSLYAFVYPDIGTTGLRITNYTVTDYGAGASYQFAVPDGYKYLRMTTKGPQTGDRTKSLSIKRCMTADGNILLVKGEEVATATAEGVTVLGQTVSRRKLSRPSNGIVRFGVQVDTSFWTDGATMQTDYGILMLPTNYTPNGTPVRLVIACHGAGTSYTADCDTVPVQPAEYLVKCLGYAVMDVNGYPGGKLHYGSPVALRSYLAAYRYVVDNYNIRTDGCFVYGSSMGGLSSNMIVNSGAVPVLAQGGFAPVLDHFKQCYCLPWSPPAEQRAAIAEQFGFSGSFDFSATAKDITKAEYDYYIANVDKVCGYNPMQFGCVNWLDVNPYGKVAFSAPSESWQCTVAESQNMYSSLRIYHPVPVKIWHVADDAVVRSWYSQKFVQAIKNAGCLAEYRQFASGGHIAWNVGADISVKTLEGENYTVKNSGYELGIWFKRFG